MKDKDIWHYVGATIGKLVLYSIMAAIAIGVLYLGSYAVTAGYLRAAR